MKEAEGGVGVEKFGTCRRAAEVSVSLGEPARVREGPNDIQMIPWVETESVLRHFKRFERAECDIVISTVFYSGKCLLFQRMEGIAHLNA